MTAYGNGDCLKFISIKACGNLPFIKGFVETRVIEHGYCLYIVLKGIYYDK